MIQSYISIYCRKYMKIKCSTEVSYSTHNEVIRNNMNTSISIPKVNMFLILKLQTSAVKYYADTLLRSDHSPKIQNFLLHCYHNPHFPKAYCWVQVNDETDILPSHSKVGLYVCIAKVSKQITFFPISIGFATVIVTMIVCIHTLPTVKPIRSIQKSISQILYSSFFPPPLRQHNMYPFTTEKYHPCNFRRCRSCFTKILVTQVSAGLQKGI